MLTFAAILFGLALIDSMSIGTLFIPLWLLLAPGEFSPRRLVVYLATLMLFYFASGILLMLGASVVIDAVLGAFAEGGALDNPLANGVMAAIGAVLVVLSFRKPKKRAGPSRMERWRARAADVSSFPALASLALAAGVLEIWTMLPYLGAVALIGSSDFGWGGRIGWLAAYCVLMVLPAIVMVLLRAFAGRRFDPALGWLNAQMDRHGGGAALWMIGIAGALLAWFGASRLFGF